MFLPPAWLGPCPQGKGLELRAQQSAKTLLPRHTHASTKQSPSFQAVTKVSVARGRWVEILHRTQNPAKPQMEPRAWHPNDSGKRRFRVQSYGVLGFRSPGFRPEAWKLYEFCLAQHSHTRLPPLPCSPAPWVPPQPPFLRCVALACGHEATRGSSPRYKKMLARASYIAVSIFGRSMCCKILKASEALPGIFQNSLLHKTGPWRFLASKP